MGPVAHLDTAIAQHLDGIRAAAVASAAGGGPAWDAMLAHYGVARLADDERRQIVAAMVYRAAAVPAELPELLAGWSVARGSGRARCQAGPEGTRSPRSSAAGPAVRRRARRLRAPWRRAPPPPQRRRPPRPPPSAGFLFATPTRPRSRSSGQPVYANVATRPRARADRMTPAILCRYCRRPIAGTRAR